VCVIENREAEEAMATRKDRKATKWEQMSAAERRALSPVERAQLEADHHAEKAEQARARIADLKSKMAAEERRRDTRRKILRGAFLEEALEEWRAGPEMNRNLARFIEKSFDNFLKKDADRALFGFQPRYDLSDHERGTGKRNSPTAPDNTRTDAGPTAR
jgi:hypothetical protein